MRGWGCNGTVGMEWTIESSANKSLKMESNSIDLSCLDSFVELILKVFERQFEAQIQDEFQ